MSYVKITNWQVVSNYLVTHAKYSKDFRKRCNIFYPFGNCQKCFTKAFAIFKIFENFSESMQCRMTLSRIFLLNLSYPYIETLVVIE